MKRNILLSVFISITLIVIVILHSCTSEQSKLKIGVILPLTGTGASAGEFMKMGIDAAEQNWAKDIDVIIKDSQNQGKVGLNVYNQLLLQGVKFFVVAHSGVAQPVTTKMAKDNVVGLVIISSAEGIPEKGENIFRMFVTAKNEANTSLNFLANKNINKLLVLYINDDFGLSGFNEVDEKYIKANIKEIRGYAFNKNQTDYRNFVTKSIAWNPDAIYVIGYGESFALCIKNLKETGYRGILLTSIGLSVPAWRKIVKPYDKNIYFTNVNYSPDDTANVQIEKLRNIVLKKYDKLPNFMSAFAWDAINVYGKALISLKQKNIDVAPHNLINILKNINYEGAIGPVKFDNNGEADFPLALYFINENSLIKKVPNE